LFGFLDGTPRAPKAIMRPQIEARTATFAQSLFDICQIVSSRPGGRGPADQLLDAATSAAANYRAAGRARSSKEFVAKLGLANEESDECVYWLDFIANTALGQNLDLSALRTEAAELRSIIAKSYATARQNRDTSRARKPPPQPE
jgi:four helix bundle protein